MSTPIDQQIETATSQLSALIDALNGMIAALPDNPRIHRMNDRCFVVSKKDLGHCEHSEGKGRRCNRRAAGNRRGRKSAVSQLP